MQKITQKHYENYCLRNNLYIKKCDENLACDQDRQIRIEKNRAEREMFMSGKILGRNVGPGHARITQEESDIIYDKLQDGYPLNELFGVLNGFFDDVTEPFIFVELSQEKPGLAWLCDNNTFEQISLKKKNNRITEKDNQEHIQKKIPVIREVAVSECKLCGAPFLINSVRNHHLWGGLLPHHCPDCKEKKGLIRSIQRNLRDKLKKQGIDPDVVFEIVEGGENIVHIREGKNKRRTLTETKFYQESGE